MHENGFFYNANNTAHFVKNKSQLPNYSLLQIVAVNKTYFLKQEIKGADASRETQEYLFYPGTKALKTDVADNLAANCSITADDFNRYELAYGTPAPCL